MDPVTPPPGGPAIRGAMLTVTGEDGVRTTYVRHEGLWVPLLVPLLDWDVETVGEVSTWRPSLSR